MNSNVSFAFLQSRQLVASRQFQFRGAGFVSLGGLVNSGHGNAAVPDILRTKGADLPIQEEKPRKRRSPSSNVPYQQKLPQTAGVDKILEGLFLSNQQQRSENSRLRYSGTCPAQSPKTSISRFQEENELLVLKRMFFIEKAPLENLWSQCQKVIRSKAWEFTLVSDSDEHDIFSRRDVFRELLLAICRSRSQEPFRSSLPPPSTVIKTYLKNKLMRYWWDNVLWIQIGVLVDWNNYISTAAQTVDVPATENAVRLCYDILGVWEIFMDHHGDHKSMLSFQSQPKTSNGHDIGPYSTPSIHAFDNKAIDRKSVV